MKIILRLYALLILSMMSNGSYASIEVGKIKIDDEMTFFHKENIVSNDLKDNQYIIKSEILIVD